MSRDITHHSEGFVGGVTAVVGFKLTERVFEALLLLIFAAEFSSRTVIQPTFQGLMEIIEPSHLLLRLRVRYTDRVSGLL